MCPGHYLRTIFKEIEQDRDEVGLGRGLAGMGDLASLCLSFPIHKIETKMEVHMYTALPPPKAG